MYVPEYFRETRIDVLRAFVERHPLATLVAMTAQGLTANHVPLRSQLLAEGGGILHGHIARANSLWRELKPESEVLAIFTGAEGYVEAAACGSQIAPADLPLGDTKDAGARHR